jgi:hypothetical protein
VGSNPTTSFRYPRFKSWSPALKNERVKMAKIPKELKEKIRIFLTDQYRSRSKVQDLSRQVMLTVSEFYPKPELADDYRKNYGLRDIHTMGLDSGGFQFLQGKGRAAAPVLHGGFTPGHLVAGRPDCPPDSK